VELRQDAELRRRARGRCTNEELVRIYLAAKTAAAAAEFCADRMLVTDATYQTYCEDTLCDLHRTTEMRPETLEQALVFEDGRMPTSQW